MSFLQVGDISSRVKRQFGDESGVQVTDDDIYRWISDAVRNVILSNEDLIEASTTTDLVGGQQDYSLPDDLISLKGLTCKSAENTSYFRLDGYQLEQFNEYVDGWDGTFFGNGIPAIFTIFNNAVKIFPVPDVNATNGLKFFYTTYLSEITGATSINIPKIYFNILVDYCLQKAYEMDEDWIAAEIKMQVVEQSLRRARGKTKPQQDIYNSITVLDDDRW